MGRRVDDEPGPRNPGVEQPGRLQRRLEAGASGAVQVGNEIDQLIEGCTGPRVAFAVEKAGDRWTRLLLGLEARPLGLHLLQGTLGLADVCPGSGLGPTRRLAQGEKKGDRQLGHLRQLLGDGSAFAHGAVQASPIRWRVQLPAGEVGPLRLRPVGDRLTPGPALRHPVEVGLVSH